MTNFVAKTFGISRDRASRIVRTFWQAFIGLVLSTLLLILNAALDVIHGQGTGTASAIWTAALTVLIAIIKNIKDNKREYGDASGTSDEDSTGIR